VIRYAGPSSPAGAVAGPAMTVAAGHTAARTDSNVPLTSAPLICIPARRRA
jgi:hypothetical protein